MKSAVAAIMAGLGLFILPAAAQDAPPASTAAPSPVAPTQVAPSQAGLPRVAPQDQIGEGMLAFYGYAKLSGQVSDADLEKRLIAEGPNLRGAVIKADFMRCGGEASARSDAMQTILEPGRAPEEAAGPQKAPDAPKSEAPKPDAAKPDAATPDAPHDAPKEPAKP